ncbi:hypothetical protein [Kitasatospora sp. NPDC088134]|uniref:hypothetical protein n=1 Tax=Kitasatospora sp. NPDC088134 TaxID=3364071 RepID=UPI00380FC139
MSTSGKGYQVEVDSLRAFAAQVRNLLKEFEEGAGSQKVYGSTGLGANAFGTFPDARALYAKYSDMRVGLSQFLDQLQQAIDYAQQNADHTATNYEEQEAATSKHLTLAGDGWSSTWDKASLDRANTVKNQAAGVTTAPAKVTDATRPQW